MIEPLRQLLRRPTTPVEYCATIVCAAGRHPKKLDALAHCRPSRRLRPWRHAAHQLARTLSSAIRSTAPAWVEIRDPQVRRSRPPLANRRLLDGERRPTRDCRRFFFKTLPMSNARGLQGLEHPAQFRGLSRTLSATRLFLGRPTSQHFSRAKVSQTVASHGVTAGPVCAAHAGGSPRRRRASAREAPG